MATYPLATLGCTVDSSGIYSPSYNDIYQSLIASFQLIYGTDIYVEPDSQDGQLIAAFASIVNDLNNATIAAFRGFSPVYGQGAQLSSLVKINGLARLGATNSTADVTVSGAVGTIITNGVVKDVNGNKWDLPASVTIPTGGTITVQATAQSSGAIVANAGDINVIDTPQLGWDSVTNATAATSGTASEDDVTLRARQVVSTMLPAQSVLDGIYGDIANITGVTNLAAYENDTSTTDANGLPSHSICMVVEGGDPVAIATAIANKKTPGTGTYGTTSETVTNSSGVPLTINFLRPTVVAPAIAINITALTGYLSTIGDSIIQSVVDYVNSLPIGGGNDLAIPYDSVYFEAKNIGANNDTYKITGLTIGGVAADYAMTFDELAQITTADVTLTVA